MKRSLAIAGLALFVVGLIYLAWPTEAGEEAAGSTAAVRLLNVSYDPTRELYQAYNQQFVERWQKQHGQTVSIEQSHGGSGKQARSVIDGLEADVVTLALAGDIDAIAEKSKLLPVDWQGRLPQRSTPYYSTQVFLVREGNPKGIRDWSDLVKPGVSVVMPNPKTSGGARWIHLAVVAWAQKQHGEDEGKIFNELKNFYKNVPVLDSGARGASNSFTRNGVGDVLVTWENEAHLLLTETKTGYALVIPPLSVRAEPPVAVVDANVKRHGTEAVARAYLEGLYTPEAQRLVAQHHYRPSDPAVLAEFKDRFPTLELIDIQHFGGWGAVQQKHFSDGGVFDRALAAAQAERGSP